MMDGYGIARGLTCTFVTAALSIVVAGPNTALAQATTDERSDLDAGWLDAATASDGLELVTHRDRPPGFFDPTNPGAGGFSNTDLAFEGNRAYVGNYNGFNVYDITDPTSPEHLVSVVCPGGQGDLSVDGNLLFMSVQENRSRIDCGLGTPEEDEMDVVADRFKGVRIFDVSDIGTPVQVAAIQTCRGSHTHTLVRDPDDDENVYIYVSGTSRSRVGEELAGCVPDDNPDDPNTAYWRISVIQVPLDAPENARVVAEPRVFEDPATGAIDGLWPGGDHGPDTQSSGRTTSCHDITAYPEIGLAAGACQGNGVLFDISDPANPFRIDDVSDPNFAYWHSATFNNDGTKVLFTDEWGGGSSPRCRADDPETWGANAVFDVVNRQLVFGGYYKLPTVQTETENCVAHNGSLIPVPGRDIKVQAWYQGGVSVFDFTDSANPFEIAYFDRGPLSDEDLMLGGYWSSYWYNGYVYGSEIARGFDVLELEPSEYLSENEIAAARLVQYEQFNPQEQPSVTWPPAFVVAQARLDQLARVDGVDGGLVDDIRGELDDIEGMPDGADKRAALAELAVSLWADANATTGDAEAKLRALAGSVLDLAAEG